MRRTGSMLVAGTLILLCPFFAGLAYGACDAALLHKLIDKGFSKAEILQLCGTKPQLPPSPEQRETPDQHVVPTPKQPVTGSGTLRQTPVSKVPSSSPALPRDKADTPQPTTVDAPQAPSAKTKQEAGVPSVSTTNAAPETTQKPSPHSLTVYHNNLVWHQEIHDVRLKTSAETRKVWVEVVIFEDAGTESEWIREATPALRDFTYEPDSQAIIYTDQESNEQVVCGTLVTRRALLGRTEEVVLTDRCTLEFVTRPITLDNKGRPVRRNYGTVVLHIRE